MISRQFKMGLRLLVLASCVVFSATVVHAETSKCNRLNGSPHRAINSSPPDFISESPVLKWAKSAGGAGFDFGQGIATDHRGNAYMTGMFEGSATFGAGQDNEIVLTSAGSFDVVLTKYGRDGQFLWAKSAGGSATDFVQSIATDNCGNTVLTGSFSGTATFGQGEDNEVILSSAGGADIFVAKYDGNGFLLWAKSAGGTNSSQGLGIAIDRLGNNYVTGNMRGTVTFGAGQENETVLSALGPFGDIFVAKYSQDGLFVWVKQAGGGPNASGLEIASNSRGDSYITGGFAGTAIFGLGEENETVLTSAGGSDIFVAKYDQNGQLIWAKSATSINSIQGIGIAISGPGDSYITGSLIGTVTFGAGEGNETALSAAGPFSDVFVAKYNRDGLLLWATSAGSNLPDGGTDIATDRRGDSYVTGRFESAAIFGLGEENETVLTSAGRRDVFVAKYNRAGKFLWVTSAGGIADDEGLGVVADRRGEVFVTGTFAGTATFGAGGDNETVLSADPSGNIFIAKYSD